jgi:hypothetical protein
LAAEPSSGQEYAERPKEGEGWRGMIERQQREGNAQGGNWRELLRSLPQEQQQEKERGGRGDISPSGTAQPPLTAEVPQQSYQDILREAAQRAVPEQDRAMER